MDWVTAAAVLIVPVAYFLLARRHRGFREQPAVVGAGEPGAFATALGKAGGAASVRTGLWIDLGFIAALTLPAGAVLVRSDRPWLTALPVVASGLDLIENALLSAALRSPTPGRLRLLRRLCPVKLVAYVVALGTGVIVALAG